MSLTEFHNRVGKDILATVPTISDLRATHYYDNAVMTLAGASLDDGQGGVYRWDSTSIAADDGISIVASDNIATGRWKRISYSLTNTEDAQIVLGDGVSDSTTVPFQEATYTFQVKSALNWAATTNVDWIEIQTESGVGSTGFFTFTYKVLENPDTENARVGIIEISNGIDQLVFTVTQTAFVETLSTTAQSVLNFAAEGSSNYVINIYSNTNWILSSTNSWINIDTPTGSGDAIGQFDIAENTSNIEGREGTILLETASGSITRSITIQQAVAASYLLVDDVTVDGNAGTHSLNVESDTGWTVSTQESWITLSQTSGFGDAILNFDVDQGIVKRGRTGIIVVQSTNGYYIRNVIVTQLAYEEPAIDSANSFVFKWNPEYTVTMPSNDGPTFLFDTDNEPNKFKIFTPKNVFINWGDGSPEEYYGEDNTISPSRDASNYPSGTTEATVYIKQAEDSDTCQFTFEWKLWYITEIVRWGKMKVRTMGNFGKLSTFTGHESYGPQTLPSNPNGDFDTSEAADFSYAFSQWKYSGEFPYMDFSSATTMTNCWTSNYNVTSFATGMLATIPSTVTSLTGTWTSCSSWNEQFPTFPNLQNSNSLESLANTWENCKLLTGTVPYIDTSNVTSMYRTWQGCENLTGAFPAIDTTKNLDFRYTWFNCKNITSFPHFTINPAVTELRQTWSNCENITSFPLLDTSNIEIFKGTWSQCFKLESVHPDTDTSSATDIRDAWQGCKALTGTFPNIDTSNVVRMSDTWRNCTGLAGPDPNINTSNVEYMNHTWYNNEGIVNFPSIDTSKVKSMNFAWGYCENMVSMENLDNETFDTSSVTDLGLRSTWAGCKKLVYNKVGFDPITEQRYAFPDIDTSGCTDLQSTWSACESLVGIFPSINTNNVTNFNSTWYGCQQIILFPSINVGLGTNFNYTWNGCGGLVTFEPFLNTTYSPAIWNRTFGSVSIIRKGNNNPFINLDSGASIPVGGQISSNPSDADYRTPFDESSGFRPRFDVSNVNRFEEETVDIIASNDYEIFGFENITFPQVDRSGYGDWPEVVLDCGNFDQSIIDDIITAIESNSANHTLPADDDNSYYELRIKQTLYNNLSAAAQTAITNLANDADTPWTITLI